MNNNTNNFIKLVDGNILHASEHIIAHQVNGLGIMGGGLAKQIRDAYPQVYQAYRAFVRNYPTPKSLLGLNYMVTESGLPVQTFDKTNPKSKIIANLFGQARISRTVKQTDESALRASLEHLVAYAKLHNLSVALPHNIGCGLGGGNWDEILDIIRDVFHDYPVTIYRYNPSR